MNPIPVTEPESEPITEPEPVAESEPEPYSDPINPSLRKERLQSEALDLSKPISPEDAVSLFKKHIPLLRNMEIEFEGITDDGSYCLRYFEYFMEDDTTAGFSNTLGRFLIEPNTGEIDLDGYNFDY